jgi:hypothetical protein
VYSFTASFISSPVTTRIDNITVFDLVAARGASTLFAVGEVDSWIFNFLQFAIDGKNNSETKVEKVFVFYFHVFLCGNEFF